MYLNAKKIDVSIHKVRNILFKKKIKYTIYNIKLYVHQMCKIIYLTKKKNNNYRTIEFNTHQKHFIVHLIMHFIIKKN